MKFKKHYAMKDLEDVFDETFRLPEGFLFGVANSGFQVEGGFNGKGEPLNNWAILERAGKVEPSGEAVRFWGEYQKHIELAKSMGLNGFRMSIEWARVQPSFTIKGREKPPFDEKAVERYAEIIASIMKEGMEPVITLLHFTHPLWLGIDFWANQYKIPFFETYVREITQRLNTLLVEKHGLKPVRFWLTMNEPNGLAFITHLLRQFPHEKSGLKRAISALDNMIVAHCRAYDAVHEVYKNNGWEEPMVSYNTIHLSLYHTDKVMTDLLNARVNGVPRKEIGSYLKQGKALWDEEIAKSPEIVKPNPLLVRLEKLIDGVTEKVIGPDTFPKGIQALYSSPNEKKLDYLGVDFYDPFLRNMIALPSSKDISEKRFNFNSELWEQILNPRAFYHFLKAETFNCETLPIYILESGMCYRVHENTFEPRYDGATIDNFLQCYIFEVMKAMKDGLPIKSYFYWTMVDNYEWGSYEPRFGLFYADRSKKPVEISDKDASGTDAAGAYRDIIAALRSGNREQIIKVFMKEKW